MNFPPDYLDLDRANIDAPDAVYERFRFLYADGVGHIIARSGYAIRSEVGTFTVTGPRSWRVDTDEGPWLIERAKGCMCSGQPITPKAMA